MLRQSNFRELRRATFCLHLIEMHYTAKFDLRYFRGTRATDISLRGAAPFATRQLDARREKENRKTKIL